MELANNEQAETMPQDAPTAQTGAQPPQATSQDKTQDSGGENKEADAEAQAPDAEMPDAAVDAPENTEPETGPPKAKDDAPDLATDAPKAMMNENKPKGPQESSAPKTAVEGETAVEPNGRDEEAPSNILEKGIIYFFFRGRVNVEEPHKVNDIARSYMVMRPMPLDAKLGDGPIGDDGNCRLLAVPKKVLPLSGKDQFLTFVEKTKTSFSDIKTNLSASDYATKTVGTSHTPAMTPVAEGVYAITSTGRESHLAYIINIPTELGELQKDIGIRESGSFITSAKNPEASAPANASLPKGADYPKE